MEQTEIKIRPLKRKDRKTLTTLIRKFADKIGTNNIANIIVSDVSGNKSEKPERNEIDIFTKIGIDLVKQMLDLIEDDITSWFCDLVGKTKEEFDEMDFDIDLIIINQIIREPKVNSFFTHALRAYNTMIEYGRQARMKKAK